MIQKAKKHYLLFFYKLHQNNELKKLRHFNNTTLNIFLNSFEKIVNKNCTKEEKQDFNTCERYRQNLLKDSRLVSYSIFNSEQKISLKVITKKGASKKVWAQLLYFITKYTINPFVLEIGTNVGISGSYMLHAMKDENESKFITLEGLPQLCELTNKHFSTIKNKNTFEVIQGLYDDTFSKVLQKDINFNVFFIDGNHKKTPTILYFGELLKKISTAAIFIIDDINWSTEMQEAWQIIKNNSNVNFAIDLYKLGIIVIDPKDENKNVFSNLFLSY